MPERSFSGCDFIHLHALYTYIKGINDISGNIMGHIAALKSALPELPHAAAFTLLCHLEALV